MPAADLRARRDAADAAQRARRRWYPRGGLPWWVTVPLGRLSPTLIVVLLLLLLLVAILMTVRYFYQARVDAVATGPSAAEVPISYDGKPALTFGQRIPPLERLRYQRFGYPLHVGPRGVPLVEVSPDGDARELTELEMTFPHDRTFLSVPGAPGVVYAPGSTGYGVRWREPVHESYRDLPAVRAVDRIGWFVAQEALLDQLVQDVMLPLHQVSAVPAATWDRRWAESLRAAVDAINQRYAHGEPERWALVSGLVRCDPALDYAFRDGVTEGCPSVQYRDATAMIWVHMGRIVQALGRIADAQLLLSHHRHGAFYERTEVADYQAEQVALLEVEMDEVRGWLALLRRYGDAEGYHVQIVLP